MRFSPAIFAVTYSLAYAVVLVADKPLFHYYPDINVLSWSWQPLADSGPAMAWYGIMAIALAVALTTAYTIRGIAAPRELRRTFPYTPLAAMAICVYVMRQLLFV